MGRTAVSKHLTILKEAGLVRSRKVGKETKFTINAEPLKEVSDWVSYYEEFWQARLLKLDSLLKKQLLNTLEVEIMAADVVLDFHYEADVETVWKALTESDMLSQWIMDNNFKAEEGYSFQFTSEPNEWWDGIIKGEVTAVNAPNKLSYTWYSAGEETFVEWTLSESSSKGTDLHFEMSGFSEETKSRPGAIDGAIYSWTEFANKLKTIID